MITEYTKENLIGRNIIDLAWKDDNHPREFTFIFYPTVDLADALHELVEVMKANMIYNSRITFNCTKIVPTIEIKSIFCLNRWHFFMEPEVLEKLIEALGDTGINIVWLEDKDFGVRLDKKLNIIDFWYPDEGG